MKKDSIYPFYIEYLNNKLNEGKITKGSLSLLKLSNSSFSDFKYRFENDELFHDKVIELHKSEIRDKKINDLFNDFD